MYYPPKGGERGLEQITSRHNAYLTHVRKLLSRRDYRRACGQFVIDGTKLTREALSTAAPPEAIICTDEALLPPVPPQVRVIGVPQDVMQSLSPMRAPQGVLTVCPIPQTEPEARLDGRRYLVLDGLQDPGNVGTIWRTADALGADGLLLTNDCADPWNPKTVRATMGACFRLPVYEVAATDLPDLLARSGLDLYATALRGDARDVREADFDRCAVLIGSEGAGVSPELLAQSRFALKIPMRARCESLNAAAAAAVVLWEMARQDR